MAKNTVLGALAAREAAARERKAKHERGFSEACAEIRHVKKLREQHLAEQRRKARTMAREKEEARKRRLREKERLKRLKRSA